ncbi:MAG: tripartite tricarboxylate transporter substrate binding protein [Deltaproteobacteria bacterium]|jgi:tripartite-type tricarboxylate transporter receptor subunit TctC|nr:tripartite tricarboxylate transporter substrate binding protein [Deltaproteobacteria bacterium]
MKRSLTAFLFALCLTCLAGMPAIAAEGAVFTDKITFLIGNAAGGGNDLLVRALLPGMEKALGVDVTPEILLGANGGVAAVRTGQSKPDGQTLYLHSQSVVMMQYTGQPQVNVEKLAAVAQVVEDFSCWAVAKDSPYNNIKDVIAAAKANPGKIKVGTTSAGSWPINLALVKEKAGVDLRHVPYSGGGAPAGVAVAAGEVDLAMDSPIVYRSLVDGGKLKVICTFGTKRSPVFPNVPTAKEQGVDVEFPVWRMVFTTKGTPEKKLAALSAAVKKAMEGEAFLKYAENSGLVANYKDHKASQKLLNDDNVIYRDLLTKLGLKTSDPK